MNNEIIMIDVPQEVRVRKYEVDIPNLQILLKVIFIYKEQN